MEQPAQGEGLLRGVQLREHRGDARLLGEMAYDRVICWYLQEIIIITGSL